jgi:hypothetical protein
MVTNAANDLNPASRTPRFGWIRFDDINIGHHLDLGVVHSPPPIALGDPNNSARYRQSHGWW